MAAFYGTIQGARGRASRLGHKASGLTTEACSWQGKVTTELYVGQDGETILCCVSLAPHHGQGVHRVLYEGPIGGAQIGLRVAS